MERTNDTQETGRLSFLWVVSPFCWRSVAQVLGALLIVACTSGVKATSPDTRSTPNPAQAQTRTQPYAVSATGREWTSQMIATEAPAVGVQSGYHHVVASLGSERPLNCFVYQVPIDAGQAVLRLLRAISVGLEFETFEPQSIELIGEAPVMWFKGRYREGDTGRPGVLRVVISPRRQFPVVCTHDQQEDNPRYFESVRAFLDGLRFNQEEFEFFAKPSFYEVWKLSDAEGMLGFSTFQMFEESQGVSACLEIGATFRWEGEALRTTDRIALENEDEVGLKSGKWLDVASTRPILQVMLERQDKPGFHYRTVSEINGKKALDQFETKEPLLSSAVVTRRLLENATKSEERVNFSLFQFLPAYSMNAGTELRFEFQPTGQGLVVERAARSSFIELGKDGLPERARGQGSQIAHLLHRSHP